MPTCLYSRGAFFMAKKNIRKVKRRDDAAPVSVQTAVTDYSMAASLIIRDARPLMILESVERRPITSVARVRRAVRRGELRYALIGGSCGTARRPSFKCHAAVRWIRAHSVDVTRETGLGSSGFVFRLLPSGQWRGHGRV